MSTNISAKRLADFIAAVQEHETLLMQRLRDLESVGVRSNLTPNKLVVPQLNQIITPVPNFEPNSQDVTPEEVLSINDEPLDVTRLPTLGEYR